MPDNGDWPADLRGITETVVTTRGPDDRWNLAALGVHEPGLDVDASELDVDASGLDADASGLDAPGGEPDGAVATARTWGRTRTRRNFEREGEGYVQFTDDPVDFAEAALTVREETDPVLEGALAWARVAVVELDRGEEAGTEWVDWALDPTESEVRRRVVPTINRGYAAVVEATVAASRLDVPGYDRATLQDRLSRLADVIERCGGDRERQALAVVRGAADW